MNQRTAELAADILGSKKSPLEYLLEVMMDGEADQKRRDWAAEKASAYIHPRPASVARPIQINIPSTATASEIPGAISDILQAVGRGEISPSEAEGVVSIIEAQRKALETAELLRRIEELEAAAGKR